MTDGSGGFFDRWSKRKLEQRTAQPVAAPTPATPPAQGREVLTPTREADGARAPVVVPVGVPVAPPDAASPAGGAAPAEFPTLEDASRLTPDSDFRPFLARGVAPGIKNAAMKKLFADPRFNVMDRLDTYIDDYSQSDPIPEAMLRQMVSARFLHLFGDDGDKADPQGAEIATSAAQDGAYTPAAEMVAQSPAAAAVPQQSISSPPEQTRTASSGSAATDTPIEHDHPDLRLQPDHAPAAGRARRGPA